MNEKRSPQISIGIKNPFNSQKDFLQQYSDRKVSSGLRKGY